MYESRWKKSLMWRNKSGENRECRSWGDHYPDWGSLLPHNNLHMIWSTFFNRDIIKISFTHCLCFVRVLLVRQSFQGFVQADSCHVLLRGHGHTGRGPPHGQTRVTRLKSTVCNDRGTKMQEMTRCIIVNINACPYCSRFAFLLKSFFDIQWKQFTWVHVTWCKVKSSFSFYSSKWQVGIFRFRNV